MVFDFICHHCKAHVPKKDKKIFLGKVGVCCMKCFKSFRVTGLKTQDIKLNHKTKENMVVKNTKVRFTADEMRKLRNRINNAIINSFNSPLVRYYLGCSVKECREHIEKKFKDGMNWDNHGLFGWHIDHIIPVKYYINRILIEQKECFHFSNYQPLWAEENLSKSAKLIGVIT
jgi:hypothetical protein